MNKRILFIVFVLFISTVTCTSTPAVYPTSTQRYVPRPSPTTALLLDTTIDWNEAFLYIGEYKIVCGPVVDSNYASSSNGQPTFLNLGKRYPDPDRFTVVIWGRNRGNFPANPEQYYFGETICVSGLIEEYNGIPEIEASSSSQIEIR